MLMALAHALDSIFGCLARTAALETLAAIILLGMTFTGCATPTTGVVPRGDDMYTVTRQGQGFWVSVDSLKVEALKEADSHCNTLKQKLKFIHSKEIPAGALGRWPESEVLFKCE